jgi:hypothetical protein
VHDDKSGSRGADGSPRDRDGGIASRSSPASDAALIASIDDALQRAPFPNLVADRIERTIRRWRAKHRHAPLLHLGRNGRPPKCLAEDVKRLRALRTDNPGSDCRAEFEDSLNVGKQQRRLRYQAAHEQIAKEDKSRKAKRLVRTE